ncbi:Glutamine transport ATP-binding protein GlnQ [bioreactor metagenome]|uniref:Glutamine transport ATP-binding protein GlnQ n=1 Tax=bioreactor metagenome TaxID=1076179 RepID=A0A644XP43_9ZZZZ
MLKLRHICKTFLPKKPNAQAVLNDVNLHLYKGEFVTLLGSNGTGKSTLLDIIAGSRLPDSGTVLLDGCDVTFQKEHLKARSIGRLFQDPLRGTAPDLTIEENLTLAALRGRGNPFAPALNRRESAKLRDRIARLGMGLEDRMKTRMGLLSGGERQAVTLLMSILSVPKLLLLDEHTAALDPAAAESILQLTAEIVAEHSITTLMITHDIASALSVGTRTLMLDEGRIALDLSGERRAQTSPKDLKALYKI